jgi:hypothetical protein
VIPPRTRFLSRSVDAGEGLGRSHDARKQLVAARLKPA